MAYFGLNTGVAALSSVALSSVFFTRYPRDVFYAPTCIRGIISMVKVLAIDFFIHLTAATTYHGTICLFYRTKAVSPIVIQQMITGALIGGILATTARVVLVCFCAFFILDAFSQLFGDVLDTFLNIPLFLFFNTTTTKKSTSHPLWTLAKLTGKTLLVVLAIPFVFFATSTCAINYHKSGVLPIATQEWV